MRARASESELVIEAQNLSKTYEFYRQPQGLSGAVRSLFHRELTSVQAVSGLDLSVKRGEIIGLLGPNGAGKTSIVKMLCGLLVPSEGSLSVCGHRPADRSYAFLSQISVIFGQKAMLWWDVSTRESLKIHRSMYEISGSDFSAAVRELGDLLGITDILDTPVRNLSLGQRMRCELALALLHKPALLFADEPTLGLDVEAKLVVRNLFRDINRTLGTTVVLTSHDMNDVEALSERVVIIIKGGRAAFDGSLATLRAHANIPREVVLNYRDAPQLPPEHLGASIDNGPHSVRLRLGGEPIGEPIGELVQAASLPTNPGRWLLFAWALAMGATMAFSLDIIVGALAFWWQDVTAVDRLRQLVTLFLSGALIPLAVMPAAWGPFLEGQPFGYIVAFPIQTLLATSFTGLRVGLAVQAAWALLSLGAARVVWIRGLRRYSGAGA